METRVLQHPEGPDALRGQEHYVGDEHLLCMENNNAGVFLHIQTDTNHPCEVQGGEVWVDGQVIVQGADGCGKSHTVPREGLTIGGHRGVFGLALIGDLSSRCVMIENKEQQQDSKHSGWESRKSSHLELLLNRITKQDLNQTQKYSLK